MNLNIHGSEAAFFLLATYSQNSILKGKFVKIMCFLELSIAKITPNFKKNCQISIMVQVGSQKYRRMGFNLFFHI